jgi:hypothetical protein
MGRHQWSAEQLAGFQQELDTITLSESMRRTVSYDLCEASSLCKLWKHNREKILGSYFDLSQGFTGDRRTVPPNWLSIMVIPRGWGDFEQANHARLLFERVEPNLGFETGIIKPEITASNIQALEKECGSMPGRIFNHHLFAFEMLTGLNSAGKKLAQAQTWIHFGVIGCALERYRIDKGQYPDKLEALAPDYLKKIPFDVINGKPLKFRLTDNGAYLLYSIGWNGVDDGGSIIDETDTEKLYLGAQMPSKTLRDWVWQPSAAAR